MDKRTKVKTLSHTPTPLFLFLSFGIVFNALLLTVTFDRSQKS